MGDSFTGIGKYVQNLVQRLPLLALDIDFYVLRNGQRAHEPGASHPNLHTVVTPEYPDARWEREFLPSFVKSHGIDLYHSTRSGYHEFQAPGCPYVVTVHDVIPVMFPDWYPAEWVERMRERMPGYLEGAAIVIAVSRRTKRDVQNLVLLEDSAFRVVYQGLESGYGPVPEPEARARVRERFGLEGQYVFYIGGFSLRKNVCGLVRAYSLLPEQTRMAYRLVLGGYRCDEFDAVVQLADGLRLGDRVLFTGPSWCSDEDVRCLLSAAALFVYPSRYEGFGLPPLEAMACGVPVVVSNAGALQEISGDGALMVDPEDREALAGAMLRVLTEPDLRRSLSERGPAVARRYSWDENARETLEAYRAVLGTR